MFKAPKDINAFLRSAISNFEGSDECQMMRVGDAYYDSDNTKIMARKKLMYARDTGTNADYLIEDPYKANNKLAAGYYKILVDQKIQYSLGKPVTIRAGKQDILDLLGKEEFPKALKKTGKAASKKFIGWAQPYISGDEKFKLMHIPSEQVIAMYKTDDADELDYAIRFYPVTILNSKDEMVKVIRVEVWDDIQVTYYQQDPENKEYKFLEGVVNPRPHMIQKLQYGDTVTQSENLSWGKVPLIPFYNNDERVHDLKPVRRHIDVYDIVESDFANNLEDIQDIYWVLKGYNGTNLDTFLNEVRKYKTLKVSDEGDAHAESVNIPTEARTAMLDRINDDIFRFGRGVDTSKTGDGNITNIVIKSRFANLDLKANEFESECRDFIDRVMRFLNRYLQINGQTPVGDYDVTFNRSMIMNETEILTANAGQQGNVSDETRLSNHPWVDDVAEEQERLEAEKPDVELDDDDLEDDIDGQGSGTNKAG